MSTDAATTGVDAARKAFEEAEKKLSGMQASRIAKALLVLAPTSVAAAYLVRQMAGSGKMAHRRKVDERIDRAVAAATPVVGFNPARRDDIDDETETRAGRLLKLSREMAVSKRANAFTDVKDAMSSMLSPFRGARKGLRMDRPEESTMMPAALLAALVGGGALGWRMSDDKSDKAEKTRLQSESDKMERLLDDLRMRTLAERWQGTVGKRSKEGKNFSGFQEMWHTVKTLWPVWSLVTGGATYAAAKRWAEKKDERRAIEKKLIEALEDQARAGSRPVELLASDFGLGGRRPSSVKATREAAAAGTVPVEI